MALFRFNTECRDQEVSSLRFEWEVQVPEFDASTFIKPAQRVKNRQDRLAILNQVAKEVIEEVRGEHPVSVFTYKGRSVIAMCRKDLRRARVRAGLPGVRVQDLKHTFGRRLRAAGVTLRDRQGLLGHKS